jgi:hypothetical protein
VASTSGVALRVRLQGASQLTGALRVRLEGGEHLEGRLAVRPKVASTSRVDSQSAQRWRAPRDHTRSTPKGGEHLEGRLAVRPKVPCWVVAQLRDVRRTTGPRGAGSRRESTLGCSASSSGQPNDAGAAADSRVGIVRNGAAGRRGGGSWSAPCFGFVLCQNAKSCRLSRELAYVAPAIHQP